ncbi:MAG: DUF432 domain-containing protein [Calditrichaeota bacterium]|nr:MAG: DUF432 domain-containing protein [Calditrichota bacterium]
MAKHDEKLWGQHTIPYHKIQKFKLADLNLSLYLSEDEIKLAHHYSSSGAQATTRQDSGENVIWKRWPVSGEVSHIQFDPVLPDRPLLVKPESSLYLWVNFKSKFFVRIPIALKISMIIGNKSTELLDIPIIKLSNTWFGTFQKGEVCYSISSGFGADIEPDKSRPFLAICPLRLKNDSRESLLVDKICMRSEHFSLFQSDSQLWTDELTIIYKGKNETSQISVSGKPPKRISGATLVSKPQKILKKSLYAPSFSSQKDLAGPKVFVDK